MASGGDEATRRKGSGDRPQQCMGSEGYVLVERRVCAYSCCTIARVMVCQVYMTCQHVTSAIQPWIAVVFFGLREVFVSNANEVMSAKS